MIYYIILYIKSYFMCYKHNIYIIYINYMYVCIYICIYMRVCVCA